MCANQQKLFEVAMVWSRLLIILVVPCTKQNILVLHAYPCTWHHRHVEHARGEMHPMSVLDRLVLPSLLVTDSVWHQGWSSI